MFGNGELISLYKNLFSLKYHHNMDIDFFESLYPFEFEIYLFLLIEALEKEKERLKQRNNNG